MGYQSRIFGWLLIVTFVITGVWLVIEQIKNRPDRLPIQTVTCRVVDSSRDEFFMKLEEFGKKNSFSVKIAPLHPIKKQFGISLFRSDVELFGSNLMDIAVFRLGFYAAEDGTFSTAAVDDLHKKLLRDLSAVKGVTLDRSM
jgi:hypothetical protein